MRIDLAILFASEVMRQAAQANHIRSVDTAVKLEKLENTKSSRKLTSSEELEKVPVIYIGNYGDEAISQGTSFNLQAAKLDESHYINKCGNTTFKIFPIERNGKGLVSMQIEEPEYDRTLIIYQEINKIENDHRLGYNLNDTLTIVTNFENCTTVAEQKVIIEKKDEPYQTRYNSSQGAINMAFGKEFLISKDPIQEIELEADVPSNYKCLETDKETEHLEVDLSTDKGKISFFNSDSELSAVKTLVTEFKININNSSWTNLTIAGVPSSCQLDRIKQIKSLVENNNISSILMTPFPTPFPSSNPTGRPTGLPTGFPSFQPIAKPSGQPTGMPTGQPTRNPTGEPSGQPSGQPSSTPTEYVMPEKSSDDSISDNSDSSFPFGVFFLGVAAGIFLLMMCACCNKDKNKSVHADG
ncbi:MAG: hypothetical protein CMP39_04680 [Rickettsiales bacterium]|nr:hypothetical protein [Rickettsiales bacterium]|tara:strand:- start:8 stop:1246 length:1239 start_codon:yes stop_codon:yes gene_type:complete